MKRFKEEDLQVDANKILVYQKPSPMKTLHKTRLGITKESLNLQRLKKAKFRTWELNTLSTILNDKLLISLTKEMKLTKTVKKLNLNSNYHHNITNAGLSYLSNSLKSLTTMNEITLDFYYWKGLSADGLKRISKGLKRLRFLKKFHIDFISFYPIYPIGFEILKRPLKTLRYLQTVRLDFGPHFRKNGLPLLVKKNQGPNRILEALKRCRYLKNLCLSFDLDYLNDVPFEIFSEPLRKLAALRKICIELEESNMTDWNFFCVCKELGKLGLMKALKVNLYGCKQITDEEIKRVKEYFGWASSRNEIVISKGPERKIDERKRFI